MKFIFLFLHSLRLFNEVVCPPDIGVSLYPCINKLCKKQCHYPNKNIDYYYSLVPKNTTDLYTINLFFKHLLDNIRENNSEITADNNLLTFTKGEIEELVRFLKDRNYKLPKCSELFPSTRYLEETSVVTGKVVLERFERIHSHFKVSEKNSDQYDSQITVINLNTSIQPPFTKTSDPCKEVDNKAINRNKSIQKIKYNKTFSFNYTSPKYSTETSETVQTNLVKQNTISNDTLFGNELEHVDSSEQSIGNEKEISLYSNLEKPMQSKGVTNDKVFLEHPVQRNQKVSTKTLPEKANETLNKTKIQGVDTNNLYVNLNNTETQKLELSENNNINPTETVQNENVIPQGGGILKTKVISSEETSEKLFIKKETVTPEKNHELKRNNPPVININTTVVVDPENNNINPTDIIQNENVIPQGGGILKTKVISSEETSENLFIKKETVIPDKNHELKRNNPPVVDPENKNINPTRPVNNDDEKNLQGERNKTSIVLNPPKDTMSNEVSNDKSAIKRKPVSGNKNVDLKVNNTPVSVIKTKIPIITDPRNKNKGVVEQNIDKNVITVYEANKTSKPATINDMDNKNKTGNNLAVQINPLFDDENPGSKGINTTVNHANTETQKIGDSEDKNNYTIEIVQNENVIPQTEDNPRTKLSDKKIANNTNDIIPNEETSENLFTEKEPAISDKNSELKQNNLPVVGINKTLTIVGDPGNKNIDTKDPVKNEDENSIQQGEGKLRQKRSDISDKNNITETTIYDVPSEHLVSKTDPVIAYNDNDSEENNKHSNLKTQKAANSVIKKEKGDAVKTFLYDVKNIIPKNKAEAITRKSDINVVNNIEESNTNEDNDEKTVLQINSVIGGRDNYSEENKTPVNHINSQTQKTDGNEIKSINLTGNAKNETVIPPDEAETRTEKSGMNNTTRLTVNEETVENSVVQKNHVDSEKNSYLEENNKTEPATDEESDEKIVDQTNTAKDNKGKVLKENNTPVNNINGDTREITESGIKNIGDTDPVNNNKPTVSEGDLKTKSLVTNDDKVKKLTVDDVNGEKIVIKKGTCVRDRDNYSEEKDAPINYSNSKAHKVGASEIKSVNPTPPPKIDNKNVKKPGKDNKTSVLVNTDIANNKKESADKLVIKTIPAVRDKNSKPIENDVKQVSANKNPVKTNQVEYTTPGKDKPFENHKPEIKPANTKKTAKNSADRKISNQEVGKDGNLAVKQKKNSLKRTGRKDNSETSVDYEDYSYKKIWKLFKNKAFDESYENLKQDSNNILKGFSDYIGDYFTTRGKYSTEFEKHEDKKNTALLGFNKLIDDFFNKFKTDSNEKKLAKFIEKRKNSFQNNLSLVSEIEEEIVSFNDYISSLSLEKASSNLDIYNDCEEVFNTKEDKTILKKSKKKNQKHFKKMKSILVEYKERFENIKNIKNEILNDALKARDDGSFIEKEIDEFRTKFPNKISDHQYIIKKEIEKVVEK